VIPSSAARDRDKGMQGVKGPGCQGRPYRHHNARYRSENVIRDAYKDDLSLEGRLMVRECAALYEPLDADIPKYQQFNR
jgi:hypothetical protein